MTKAMTDAKVELARKAWWDSVCRKGDPQRQPRLITDAFEAGWKAALEQSDAVMGEAAWREGWALCKASLSDDEAFCLTADVEADAWADSKTRARSQGKLEVEG